VGLAANSGPRLSISALSQLDDGSMGYASQRHYICLKWLSAAAFALVLYLVFMGGI